MSLVRRLFIGIGMKTEMKREETLEKWKDVQSLWSNVWRSWFEYADNSYYENQEREREQEVSDLIWSLVSEFDPIDQEIIRLYNEGHTDSYISQQVNMPRSTIQWRKRMVIELLKEKMNKIR